MLSYIHLLPLFKSTSWFYSIFMLFFLIKYTKNLFFIIYLCIVHKFHKKSNISYNIIHIAQLLPAVMKSAIFVYEIRSYEMQIRFIYDIINMRFGQIVSYYNICGFDDIFLLMISSNLWYLLIFNIYALMDLRIDDIYVLMVSKYWWYLRINDIYVLMILRINDIYVLMILCINDI